MNRAERRRAEREEKKNDKLMRWLNGLNFDQKRLLYEYCKDASRRDLYIYSRFWEIVLRPKLYDAFGIDEGEKFLAEVIDNLEAEGKIIYEKFDGKGDDYVMKLNRDSANIFKQYEELKNKGIKEKEIIEELASKYPKYSVSSIKNTIAEQKRELKKAAELNEDKELDKKLEKIFEKPKEKEVEKKEVVSVKEIEFEEISKQIIVDAKGSLGVYHIENNQATIDNFTFKTEKDVDKEIALRRRVLEKELASLDLREREYKAVLKKYIA